MPALRYTDRTRGDRRAFRGPFRSESSPVALSPPSRAEDAEGMNGPELRVDAQVAVEVSETAELTDYCYLRI